MAERGSATGSLGRLAVLLPLVLGGALVVMLLLPSWATGGRSGTGPAGSSFATTDEGAKAPYLLLERLGHQVVRRVEPLGDLGRSRLAFLMAPQARLDQVDGQVVGKWLEEGGTLVYGLAPFEPSAEILRDALGLPRLVVLPVSRSEVQLGPEWAPARQVVLHAGVELAPGADLDDEEATVLAERRGRPVMLSVARGKGRIYLVDARVFSNGGLREGDNALFLAVLAGRHAGGAPITFDEYAHGFGDVVSVLGAIAWPLKLAFGVAALALLLYALAIGRRLGAISPDPAPPRRASIEQIEALASFYAGKDDRHTALLALAAGNRVPAPLVAAANDRDFVEAAQRITKGTSWP